MNKILLISLMILSLSAFAEDAVPEASEVTLENQPTDIAITPALVSSAETDIDDTKHNPYKSHWLTSFGFETSKYETIFDFQGDKKNLSPSKQELTGGRLGFGGQIYLGAGFATTSKVEGYYQGTLFTKAINAAPDEANIEFASTKKVGNVWGFDATQSLSFMFQMKTRNPLMGEWTYLTIEPFIEAGIGKGSAYQSVKYQYLLQTTREYYRSHVSDQYTNAKVSAGINFTATSGFFLYLKATQNRYDITDRKITGAYRHNSDPTETSLKSSPSNVKMDAVTIYALGGGYKF
jgi:hypothetical protein